MKGVVGFVLPPSKDGFPTIGQFHGICGSSGLKLEGLVLRLGLGLIFLFQCIFILSLLNKGFGFCNHELLVILFLDSSIYLCLFHFFLVFAHCSTHLLSVCRMPLFIP